MVRNGVFVQAYNAQAMVSEWQLVVAHAVTNQPPDGEQLVPMSERMRETRGRLPETLTADNGYLFESHAAYCEAQGVDACIAVRAKGEDEASLGRLPMTSARQARWLMQQKVTAPQGRAILKLRRALGVLPLSAVRA
jgi:hypothetical protein